MSAPTAFSQDRDGDLGEQVTFSEFKELGPALEQQVTIYPSKDTTIYSESGELANGAGNWTFTGTTNGGNFRRTLLLFSEVPSFPTGSQILAVELRIVVSRSRHGSFPEAMFYLHRLFNDWGEGASNAGGQEGRGTFAQTGDATWQDQYFGEIPWSSPGGDFEVEPSSAVTIETASSKPYVFPSTPRMISDFTTWLEDPAQNFGWLIKGTETIPGTAKQIIAADNSTSSQLPAEVRVTWVVIDEIFGDGFEVPTAPES